MWEDYFGKGKIELKSLGNDERIDGGFVSDSQERTTKRLPGIISTKSLRPSVKLFQPVKSPHRLTRTSYSSRR